ncbi:MAG: hypothetical protein AAF483_08200, partial [Planctomycetota bacterium]
PTVPRIQGQPAHRLFGLCRMTIVAVLGQNRTDVIFEKLEVLGFLRAGGPCSRQYGHETC